MVPSFHVSPLNPKLIKFQILELIWIVYARTVALSFENLHTANNTYAMHGYITVQSH
jgi:hypothetical protein